MLIEKEERINQASAAWLTACQGVFCRGVKNSAIALPCPPLSLLLFPPPPSFSSITRLLSHHHTVASFLNVSPNSPNISLTFHSIVPPPPPRSSHFLLWPISSLRLPHSRCIHCQTFRGTEWHSFNLVVVQPSEGVKKQRRERRYTPVPFKTTSTHPLYLDLLIIQLRRRFLFALRYLFSLGTRWGGRRKRQQPISEAAWRPWNKKGTDTFMATRPQSNSPVSACVSLLHLFSKG